MMEAKSNWKCGNRNVYAVLGASNHVNTERVENDYYATPPEALDYLMEKGLLPHNIWEPACGEGHLSKRLEEHGYNVVSTDLVDRGYGMGDVDFLKTKDLPKDFKGDTKCILTNPPYKVANDFVLHSLELLDPGDKVYMFLRTGLVDGKKRKKLLFDRYPPKTIYQISDRIKCARNGDFGSINYGGAVPFAWFEWEVGYKEETKFVWI